MWVVYFALLLQNEVGHLGGQQPSCLVDTYVSRQSGLIPLSVSPGIWTRSFERCRSNSYQAEGDLNVHFLHPCE